MCGRFTHRLSWAEVHGLYRLTLDPFTGRNDMPPRFNIAPTSVMPVGVEHRDGRTVEPMTWGFWPA